MIKSLMLMVYSMIVITILTNPGLKAFMKGYPVVPAPLAPKLRIDYHDRAMIIWRPKPMFGDDYGCTYTNFVPGPNRLGHIFVSCDAGAYVGVIKIPTWR